MNVLLICAGGLSTSLLVTKMKDYATSIGEVPCIEAHPADKLDSLIDRFDIVFLGPQIAHKYDAIKKEFGDKGKPIVMIAPMDYGLCRGKEVYESARKLLQE